MADFLKAHPFMTMDEYMWEVNPSLCRIMSIDNTRVHYLSEKEKKKRNSTVIDGTNLVNDLGMKVL